MIDKVNLFMDYVNKYLKYGDKIILKKEHTIRVMNLCVEIARSLNLNEKDVAIAGVCGLVHDIARFEQWKKYQSFNDIKTIDHGSLGVEILKKNNFIDKFESTEQDLVLKTVKNHNKYKIEENLSKREQLFCNIVRDVDKIDILNIYITESQPFKVENDIFSEEMYNEIFKHRLMDFKYRKTKADAIAIPIGFIYDINFKKSLEIIRENNYIEKFIDKQINASKNKKLLNQLNIIRLDTIKYIKECC